MFNFHDSLHYLEIYYKKIKCILKTSAFSVGKFIQFYDFSKKATLIKFIFSKTLEKLKYNY